MYRITAKRTKNLAFGGTYCVSRNAKSTDIFLPFGGKLNKKNRWVLLAEMILWQKAEEKYAKAFKKSWKGQKALSVRMALGALLMKERLRLRDRKTNPQITENPYLQYFIGLPSFQETEPLHPSFDDSFSKTARPGPDIIHDVNEWIVMEKKKKEQEKKDEDQDNHPRGNSKPSEDEKANTKRKGNKGKLILDATCAPADIAYPTDLRLLNEAREKLEQIMDVLHQPMKGSKRKPRTYRKKARKDYLAIAKQRKVGAKKMRKTVGKQLRYVKRDLRVMEKLVSHQSGHTRTLSSTRRDVPYKNASCRPSNRKHFPTTCVSNRPRESQSKRCIWIESCRQCGRWVFLGGKMELGQF